jgi:hypothetical protein
MFLAFLPLLLVIVLGRQADVEASAVLAAVLVGGVFASAVVHDLLWRPHRVVLTESGVILTAIARNVTISWTELKSVQRVGAGRFARLAWRRIHGRTIVTSDAFVDVHRMLTDVERRAPDVQVSS